MLRSACSLLLLACILGTPLQIMAEEGKPSAVKDLQYGEVLYHYYKQDYFNSLVRLHIAQTQKHLPHHESEAELLLGGLDLSYGLRDAANDIFTRLLADEAVGDSVRNRAWYHLARASYQHADMESALQALQHISGKVSQSNRAEAVYLQSLLLLRQGRNVEAIRIMQENVADKAWTPFLKYNLGIAKIRNDQLAEGAAHLDKIGKTAAGSEELRLLRDKANLALGFTYLKAGSSSQSSVSLDRVRLEGSLSNKALLGAGWAEASADAYSLALVPWMELAERSSTDPAVQEALLAIPYAMAKMQLHGQAVAHYNKAIDTLLEERHKLGQSIVAIRDGGIIAAMQVQQSDNDTDWLARLTGNQGSPALRYQVQLMASYDFQEAIRNYHDLLILQANLDRWTASMAAYDEMLRLRRQRFQLHQAAAQEALQGATLADIKQQHAMLRNTVLAVESTNNPHGLANSTESGQWQKLENISNRLANLPANEALNSVREKFELLKGVLYWQMNASYKPRLWQAKQQLAELDQLIGQSEQAVKTLSEADLGMPANMSTFDGRIIENRESVRRLIVRTSATLAKQGKRIEELAVRQLEKQKKRLDIYLTQARFSLAQTYDGSLSMQTGVEQ